MKLSILTVPGFTACLLFWSLHSNAQVAIQPSFENPYSINAAFPAPDRINRIVVNGLLNRNSYQFRGSYSSFADAIGGSAGIESFYYRNETSGAKLYGISFHYTYKLTIKGTSRNYLVLEAGFGAGMSHYEKTDSISKFYPAASPAFMLYTKKYYGGASFNNYLLSRSASKIAVLSRELNITMGAWLPIDNWKREPEIYVSPDVTYVAGNNEKSLTGGFYLAYHFLMPGLFYSVYKVGCNNLRGSLGIKAGAFRVHLLVGKQLNGLKDAKQYNGEISAFINLRHFRHTTEHWRSDDLHCPANW